MSLAVLCLLFMATNAMARIDLISVNWHYANHSVWDPCPQGMIVKASLELYGFIMDPEVSIFWSYIMVEKGLEIKDIYSSDVEMEKYMYPEYGIYIFWGYVPKNKMFFDINIDIGCREVGTWDIYIPNVYFYDDQWGYLSGAGRRLEIIQVVPDEKVLKGEEVISDVYTPPVEVKYYLTTKKLVPGQEVSVYYRDTHIFYFDIHKVGTIERMPAAYAYVEEDENGKPYLRVGWRWADLAGAKDAYSNIINKFSCLRIEY